VQGFGRALREASVELYAELWQSSMQSFKELCREPLVEFYAKLLAELTVEPLVELRAEPLVKLLVAREINYGV